eukprot:1157546-Pelagomonas_calceolata.AAC.1
MVKPSPRISLRPPSSSTGTATSVAIFQGPQLKCEHTVGRVLKSALQRAIKIYGMAEGVGEQQPVEGVGVCETVEEEEQEEGVSRQGSTGWDGMD